MAKRKSEEVEWELPHKVRKTAAVKKSTYTTQQKSAITEFAGVTQADRVTAAKYLKDNKWNSSAAIDAFFTQNSSGSDPTRATLNKVFDKYRDRDEPDQIGLEKFMELFGDLEIDPSDVGGLVFCEIVQAPSIGEITRDGFVDGWSDAGADTLPKMRSAVLQRRGQLQSDGELFKNVYNHTFALALAERQKALAVETAFELWSVLFTPPGVEWRSRSTNWLGLWREFYESRVNKAVNKDLWRQTLTFARETLRDESLGFWSEESSWPSVIDEFVEWVKARRAAGEPMEVS